MPHYPHPYTPQNPPTPRIGPDPRNAETQELKPCDIPDAYRHFMRNAKSRLQHPHDAIPGKPCPCCGQIVPQPSTSTENEPK